MTVFVAICTCACITWDLLQTPELMLPGRTTPQLLVASYLFGNLLYLWKDKIPFSRIMFGACLCIGLLFVRVSGLTYVASLCLVYCIIYLGAHSPSQDLRCFRGATTRTASIFTAFRCSSLLHTCCRIRTSGIGA